MSIGKCASCAPDATSTAALLIAVATSESSTPSSALACAAAALIRASARICADSSVCPEIGKFSTARWVWAATSASLGTLTSPIVSCSIRNWRVARMESCRPRLRRVGQSVGFWRCFLRSPRCRLASTRRRCDALLGLVGRRCGGGGAIASRMVCAIRCLGSLTVAQLRAVLLSGDRQDAVDEPAAEPLHGTIAHERRQCRGRATSKLSSARESLVLTDCPPGSARPREAPGQLALGNRQSRTDHQVARHGVSLLRGRGTGGTWWRADRG